MSPISESSTNVHIWIHEVRKGPDPTRDEVQCDGQMTIGTGGYAFRFTFREMWVLWAHGRIGTRGIGEVRLNGEVVGGSAATTVSGMLVGRLMDDPELRAFLFPTRESK